MGVAVRIVEWLRREGHDARHLRDEGLQRMPDSDIFDKAISEDRIVLTFVDMNLEPSRLLKWRVR